MLNRIYGATGTRPVQRLTGTSPAVPHSGVGVLSIAFFFFYSTHVLQFLRPESLSDSFVVYACDAISKASCMESFNLSSRQITNSVFQKILFERPRQTGKTSRRATMSGYFRRMECGLA
jgi:hypothetical protein